MNRSLGFKAVSQSSTEISLFINSGLTTNKNTKFELGLIMAAVNDVKDAKIT